MQKNKMRRNICMPWVAKGDIVSEGTGVSPVIPEQMVESLLWFLEMTRRIEDDRHYLGGLNESPLLIEVFFFLTASCRYYIICFHHGRNRAEANSWIATGGPREFGDQYLGTWAEAAPNTFRKTHVHQNPDAGWHPGGIWSSSKWRVYL